MTPFLRTDGPVHGRTPRTETVTSKSTTTRTRNTLPDDQNPQTYHGWQDDAACRGADAGLFFAGEFERLGIKARREQDALKICATCPVRRTCVEHALTHPESAGVWGLPEETLAEERKRRQRGRGKSVETLLSEAAA